MQMALASAFLLLLTLTPVASALEINANPIRRVVDMLRMMEKKIEAEGKAEKELFDKFMCYCSNGAGALQKSIGDADAKMPQVAADIEEGTAKKAQLEAELKEHQTSRDSAKAAIASATAVREKEAAAFAKTSSDYETNIAALGKAVAAVSKGMAGSFLQSSTANVLRQIVVDTPDLSDANRDLVTSFLSDGQGSDYTPKSGEAAGILKQLKDTMEKNLADATAAENTAISDFDALMAAKTKEIDANTAAIEEKTVRVGDLGVKLVQMKEDLSDTEEQLVEDKKFLKDMDKTCAAKKAEWEEISNMRTEEMKAIAETITILNDDDALELFKKTLPSPSLVQVTKTSLQIKQQALSMVKNVQHSARPESRAALDLIALALTGKKVSFDKVLALIDNLVATLKTEQQDDDHKKEYCEKQFDFTEDKKKGLEHELADLEALTAELTEEIKTLSGEIKALEDGIAALDKSVAEATADRKEENSDYTTLMANDSAAKELLGMAKNRLNKFYNPKLYKSAGSAAALIQIQAHRGDAAPPPPPESFGAYAKKSEASGGVISMIDSLIADLDKEMTEAEATEQNAQEEYEEMMKDSAEKRALDSKAITDKVSAKASDESELVKAKDNSASTMKDLMATEEYNSQLHADCDFLLNNFELRKTARAGEVDALKKAKAVLSGADY